MNAGSEVGVLPVNRIVSCQGQKMFCLEPDTYYIYVSMNSMLKCWPWHYNSKSRIMVRSFDSAFFLFF